MIIAGPGVKSGHTTPAQVYLRELYPTTCDLAAVAIPPTVSSPGFADVLKGKTDNHHKTIYGYFTDSQRMIRTDRWKYIDYPRVGKHQLFDLKVDPDETNNLIADPAQSDRVADLARKLHAWQVTGKDPLLNAAP